MTQDYIDEMAEIFLDRYFDLGDDEQTLKENIRVAGQLLEFRKRSKGNCRVC